MDVDMLSQSISNMLQWIYKLEPKANCQILDIIDHLENDLKRINEKLQQQSRFMWLQKVEDIVLDLNDLMEDLAPKEISGHLSTEECYKAKLQVKKARHEFKRLIEEVATREEEEEAAYSNAMEKIRLADVVCEALPMFGRKKEKKEIIDQLLNPNNSDVGPFVIAIVGVAGIGKKKLARSIYEDNQVIAHFGSRSILTTSNFDVEYKANSAAESHHKKRVLVVIYNLNVETAYENPDKLRQKLKEVVGGRTDMAILITTSNNQVATNIAARHVLKLQGLNQEESWSLFEHIHRQRTTYDYVRDCGGVPLLIVTVAMEMKNHSGGGGDGWTLEILQILKFMYYNNLPSDQKLCFEYCSLFPEDILIDGEKLIQLWTAEGFFLNSNNANRHIFIIPEQKFARDCFDNFVPLVFHQAEVENDHHKYCDVVRNNNSLYRMNKSMNKLAKLVTANGENIISDSMGRRVHGGILRVSFNCPLPDSIFEKANKLTTILFPYNPNNPRLPHEDKMTTSTCNKIFNTFNGSLRTLDLNDLGIKMVPSSIEDMKHLRYLDLSHNNMEKLPSCITTLIHLQTLKLSQCHFLKELPKNMGKLSFLNHLDIEGCLRLTHMPSGISKLTDLQTLSLFVASKKHVSGGLRSLTNLNELRGYLEISHLEQVKFSPSYETAKDDFLKNKQDLEFITLRWDHKEENEKEKRNFKEMVLLDYLQPHQNLKVLLIVGYNSPRLSHWLVSLQYLVKFTLNNCPKCEFLPPMHELPFLKVLQLWRLESMKFIAESNEIDFSSRQFGQTIFPSLKELTIFDCPNLKCWWEHEIYRSIPSFSCISKLNIQYCPQLACMPLFPNLDEELVLVESNVKPMRDTMHYSDPEQNSQSHPFAKLKSMVIEGIGQSRLGSWLKNFKSLEELHIRDCSNMKSLPQGFEYLSSLLSLSIERCEELVLDADISKTEWENPTELKGLTNLTSLTLRAIPKLKYLPWGIEHLQCLKDLRIYDCHGLTHLPETLSNLASLRELVISECRMLQSLPKGMERMKSLHSLTIMNCPLLLPRCQPDTGDDWPQIAHIKNILVKQTVKEGM